jgi:hypothetical protein
MCTQQYYMFVSDYFLDIGSSEFHILQQYGVWLQFYMLVSDYFVGQNYTIQFHVAIVCTM